MWQMRKKLEGGTVSMFMLVLNLGLIFVSCSSNSVEPAVDDALSISRVSIPSPISASRGEKVTITGEGFRLSDIIKFVLSSDSETNYSSSITLVSETSASFLLPENITSNTYKLIVSRDDQQLILGSTMINITGNTTIPDIDGMWVKGVVYCDGEGVSGVVVSDGYEVTTTDEKGRYYLPSTKETGYIFISVPGNYEVTTNGQVPQFYQFLEGTASVVEQKNFSLIKAENTNHVVLAMADWHLANRNNDLSQYTTNILPDINSTIAAYKAEGKKVYGLTLGDLTWELFWYSNMFDIGDYVEYMNMINCPVFNTIGNHDNNPYVPADWLSEMMYRVYLGPTYYSFNLGEIHYIVLDDVEYLNTGATSGIIGNRNFNSKVTQYQMDWLKKDLAAITDKNTPIIIASHVPLFRKPTVDALGNEEANEFNLINGAELTNIFSDFSKVHFLSGHTHLNFTVESSNLIEHNIGAICGTWWWTDKAGYSGNHLSREGSPGGYSVFEMTGTNIEWYYKGAGFDKKYQFRAYDLNTVHITAAKFAPNATEDDMRTYSGEYDTVNHSNEILVHVWGYDPEWSVEITEEGNALDVTRINAKDPLHIISYEAFRLNAGATPTSSFVTASTSNLFKARANSATSTIKIKVTDRFGNVSTESMERPKAFNLSTK